MKHINLIRIFAISTLCLLTLQIADAEEYKPLELGVSYGHGTDVTQWVQLDLIAPVNLPFQFVADQLDDYALISLLDFGFAVSKWETTNLTAYHLSTRLILRTQNFNTAIGALFLEGGFGPQLFSKPGGTNRLATALEFQSHLGLGLALSKQWSILTSIRHLSNGGITNGNAGVNAYMLGLHYTFDNDL